MACSIAPYGTAQGRRYSVRYRKPDKLRTDKRGFRTKKDAELYLASVTILKAEDAARSGRSRAFGTQSG